MSAITDPPKGGFQLSQLIYDTRYRSITIQIVALVLFLLGVGWLLNNAAQNLAALGKPLGFGFLGEAAGYDINQRLIEYNNQMSHGRAALVGVMNTLMVAVLGCFIATVLGVIIGVLRLSNNWVVARLMTFYIEALRNVPVLLWIVLTMAIFIEYMPPITDFRGDDPSATTYLFGTILASNKGIFVAGVLSTGLTWVTWLGLAISVVAVAYLRKRANRIQQVTGKRPGTFLVSLAIIVIPFIVISMGANLVTQKNEVSLIVADAGEATTIETLLANKKRYNYCNLPGSTTSYNARVELEGADLKMKRKEQFGLDSAQRSFVDGQCNILPTTAANADSVIAGIKSHGGDMALTVIATGVTEGKSFQLEKPIFSQKGIPRVDGGVHLRNSLIALTLALALYTAAFIAENVRAGIMAINKGQSEAAFALGLRPSRTMSLVILPQALRVIIPPLISQYLNLTKNSSLAIAVGYMDVTGTLGGITLNQTGREMECLLILMAIYLSISLTISTVMNWYNESVKLRER